MYDVEKAKLSGLTDLLEAGDSVTADKGFTSEKLLQDHKCYFEHPAISKFQSVIYTS